MLILHGLREGGVYSSCLGHDTVYTMDNHQLIPAANTFET